MEFASQVVLAQDFLFEVHLCAMKPPMYCNTFLSGNDSAIGSLSLINSAASFSWTGSADKDDVVLDGVTSLVKLPIFVKHETMESVSASQLPRRGRSSMLMAQLRKATGKC